MKLQGKKTGTVAGFIGYIDQATPVVDPATGKTLLTVRYKDAGVNCYKNYETITEFNADWEDYTPEPDPSFLIVKIQKLENSIKALDERLKTAEEKMLDLGIKMADAEDDIAQLKEEPTECPHREDNEQILGRAGEYDGLPIHSIFERMKQDLRDWVEKNKIDKIRAFHYSDPAGRRGVLFEDKTNKGRNTLVLIGWPAIGLKDGGIYTPDELLTTGEAGRK